MRILFLAAIRFQIRGLYKMICVVFVLFLYIIFLLAPIYAQDVCNACDKTPEEIEKYIDTMTNLVEMLPTDSSGSIVGDRESFRRVYKSQKESVRYAWNTIMSPYIPSLDAVFSDIDFVYESDPRQRDYEKMMIIHEMLAKNILLMVLANNHAIVVPESVRQDVDKELQDLGLFSLKKNAYGDIVGYRDKKTYTLLARILRQIHQSFLESYKRKWRRSYLKGVDAGFVYSDHTSRERAKQEIIHESVFLMSQDLAKMLDRFFSKLQRKSEQEDDLLLYIEIRFLDYILYIRSVHDAYSCTRGGANNMCNEKWQNIRKEIAFLKKETTVNTRNARNTFLTSWGRLKGVLGLGGSEEKDASRQRKQSLLNTYRGREVGDKDARWDIVHIENENNVMPLSTKVITRGIENTRDMLYQQGGFRSFFQGRKGRRGAKDLSKKNVGLKTKNLQETENVDLEDMIIQYFQENKEKQNRFQYLYLNNQQNMDRIETEMLALQNAFDFVLERQDQLQVEQVFHDVRRVTQQFPALSAMVHKNIDIIGSATDQGTLYNAMVEVCYEQCSNLDDKKRCVRER